jgi:hypothetical protein
MNEKQAEARGYSFTGIYSHDKEEVKSRIAEERKKGNKALLVNVPPSKYSRGHHGMGYSAYILKSPENIKAEKIERQKRTISNIEFELKRKRAKILKLETQLIAEYAVLNTL